LQENKNQLEKLSLKTKIKLLSHRTLKAKNGSGTENFLKLREKKELRQKFSKLSQRSDRDE